MDPKPDILQLGSKMYSLTRNGIPIESDVDFGPRLRDYVTQLSQEGNRFDPNPYLASTLYLSYPRGTNVWLETEPGGSVTWARTWDGCIAFNGTVPDGIVISPSTELYNVALSRLNEKTRGTLDLTVAIAEASSTKRMLSAVDQVNSWSKPDRHGNVGWRGRTRDAGGKWLEFTYGWKPLADDIYGAAMELSRFVRNETSTYSASASKRHAQVPVNFTFQHFGTLPCARTGQFREVVKIDLVLNNDDFGYGHWGSMNPATLTWESLPYSFVVDWFYDVAGYLRAYETELMLGRAFRSGSVTRSIINSGTFHAKGSRVNNSGPYKYQYDVDARGRFKYTYHERTVLGSYPSPYLPKFKVDLGWQRLISAAALLTTRIKRYDPSSKLNLASYPRR